MSEHISAFINAFNEESELPSLIASLKGIDDIVVVDHQSTDKTAEVAKKLGARVYTQEYASDIATQGDVNDFEHRYGYKPLFKSGDKLHNDAVEFNKSLQYCKNDWILYIDCDERVTWDMEKVEKLLPNNDVITCKFISAHNEDKTEKTSFTCKKLFRKSKIWFICQIHGMMYGYNLKETFTDTMKIDHWQKPKESRKSYLPILEYAFLKEQSPRMNYYLAREYFHQSEFEKAIKFFKIYLLDATLLPEICKVYTYISGCLWETGKHEESFNALFRAMRIYPYDKMPFNMMANLIEIKNPEDAQVWRKLAYHIEQRNLVV